MLIGLLFRVGLFVPQYCHSTEFVRELVKHGSTKKSRTILSSGPSALNICSIALQTDSTVLTSLLHARARTHTLIDLGTAPVRVGNRLISDPLAIGQVQVLFL